MDSFDKKIRVSDGMKEEKFYAMIEEGKVNDVVIGMWDIVIGEHTIIINFSGFFEHPAYDVWEEDGSEVEHFDDFYLILDNYSVDRRDDQRSRETGPACLFKQLHCHRWVPADPLSGSTGLCSDEAA